MYDSPKETEHQRILRLHYYRQEQALRRKRESAHESPVLKKSGGGVDPLSYRQNTNGVMVSNDEND